MEVSPDLVRRSDFDFDVAISHTEEESGVRLGEDRFEVCCIPFFAYDLALGDVVRLRDPLRRAAVGNGVVRIAVKRSEDVDAVHLRLHDLLGRLEYLCEWFAPGYVAVSLAPGRSQEEFSAGLAGVGAAVEIERILI